MKKKKSLGLAYSRPLVDFLFEAASLKRLARVGWQILGEGEETVAEHSFLTAVIAYFLAQEKKVREKEKILLMALFHDFLEVRTGDVSKLGSLYVKVNWQKALFGAFGGLKEGEKIAKLIKEYEEGKSLAAQIVHEADVLALVLELKSLREKGSQDASEWFQANVKRLKLPESRKLAREIEKTSSQNWWKKEREILHRAFLKKEGCESG